MDKQLICEHYKQRSTKHFKENKRLPKSNPTKSGGEPRCPGKIPPPIKLKATIYLKYC